MKYFILLTVFNADKVPILQEDPVMDCGGKTVLECISVYASWIRRDDNELPSPFLCIDPQDEECLRIIGHPDLSKKNEVLGNLTYYYYLKNPFRIDDFCLTGSRHNPRHVVDYIDLLLYAFSRAASRYPSCVEQVDDIMQEMAAVNRAPRENWRSQWDQKFRQHRYISPKLRAVNAISTLLDGDCQNKEGKLHVFHRVLGWCCNQIPDNFIPETDNLYGLFKEKEKDCVDDVTQLPCEQEVRVDTRIRQQERQETTVVITPVSDQPLPSRSTEWREQRKSKPRQRESTQVSDAPNNVQNGGGIPPQDSDIKSATHSGNILLAEVIDDDGDMLKENFVGLTEAEAEAAESNEYRKIVIFISVFSGLFILGSAVGIGVWKIRANRDMGIV